MRDFTKEAEAIAAEKINAGEICKGSHVIESLIARHGATREEAKKARDCVFHAYSVEGEVERLVKSGLSNEEVAASLKKHAEELKRYVAERDA